MYREVSDLSFGSVSDEEEGSSEAAFAAASAKPAESIVSWKTYTNELEDLQDVEDLEADEDQPESDLSIDSPSSSHARIRFNTTFEADKDSKSGKKRRQVQDADLPTTWAACDSADLGIVAAHLAAAALPPARTSHEASQDDATAMLLQTPLEAQDMLGFGNLDLRSCTLNRQTPALGTTQRLNMRASFSMASQVCCRYQRSVLLTFAAGTMNIYAFFLWQVLGNPIAGRSAGMFRHGSTVADQLQALTSRTGKSFAGGLRLKPNNIGINFSELKKQVCLKQTFVCCHEYVEMLTRHCDELQVQPDGADFKPETYLSRLHQVSHI